MAGRRNSDGLELRLRACGPRLRALFRDVETTLLVIMALGTLVLVVLTTILVLQGI